MRRAASGSAMTDVSVTSAHSAVPGTPACASCEVSAHTSRSDASSSAETFTDT